jgi:hypothetical protein
MSYLSLLYIKGKESVNKLQVYFFEEVIKRVVLLYQMCYVYNISFPRSGTEHKTHAPKKEKTKNVISRDF